MSQQEDFPFPGPYDQGLPTPAWSSNTGTPILTPASSTMFPVQTGPFGPPLPPPSSETFPGFSGPPMFPDAPIMPSGMPSPTMSPIPGPGPMPMQMLVPSAMPSPIPTPASSTISTPFGTINGPPDPNDAQALEAIFGPVPNYVTANTSHYNLPYMPPPYRENFVPAPLYIPGSAEDLAYQNLARENYENGLTTDPWRNEPIPENNEPQFVQRFEDLSFADQMRERRLRHRYNNTMTDAQRRDMDRRRLQRTDSHEPELDEEVWKASPGCRCVIL
ncbi:hypothetical protein TWF102_003756 [Orbilia oligospora]|uniref:Uncharacterized protein n=1 Tax=Orbilia oligospora TaxID=2813651 RepID=A0A7C8NCT4_ORBOL|nr:hypothetical protein TWF102_003756 [Orbilia oligospora]KAF3152440.1 hypothetical protein TWF594_004127 [Orbilia oligospora]